MLGWETVESDGSLPSPASRISDALLLLGVVRSETDLCKRETPATHVKNSVLVMPGVGEKNLVQHGYSPSNPVSTSKKRELFILCAFVASGKAFLAVREQYKFGFSNFSREGVCNAQSNF